MAACVLCIYYNFIKFELIPIIITYNLLNKTHCVHQSTDLTMMIADFIKDDELRNWFIYFIYAPITNYIAWFRYDDWKKLFKFHRNCSCIQYIACEMTSGKNRTCIVSNISTISESNKLI